MKRDRLKELAKDERFIAGIHNYCDRWCERCPQTGRCLNFAISQEDFSAPETHDMRNEAFWKKLSEVFRVTLDLLVEKGKEYGIDLEDLDSRQEDESLNADHEAAENHVVSRAARAYAKRVEGWFKETGELFLFPAAAADDESIKVEEAVEVIRWYQYFIAAKVIRAIRGSMEEPREDSDGSAKVALIGIDRSIGAWGAIPRYNRLYQEGVLKMISFLNLLRQAIEETFPGSQSFVRAGLD